ncbi:ABC transporter permease [Paenibacillus radicis (ex Xue et al. 2023)]|uniref:ABC-2 family transporter protein n=1 Tax=Paenibacillus radicis (ex Xue et al. 2023) TaxID=2972489 RepID=A0ABT1YAT7_9BACL|nr:ABC-2 family transporter protein [Paenibacillus radicis (ex Xue et al. 2023)]MCR8630311.1 ABC-2 family transporter protein [Paenibacillus radicis (ex Xue et al. 2023)]
MKLYFQYMLLLFKSQLQYRASFLLLTLGQCLTPFTVFAGLYFMFERFGQIEGWTFYEVALCFAVTHMAFSITECFARGFDVFSSLVISGDFDRLLVRPRSTVVQVFGSRFEFARVGRLFLSFIVLIWATFNIQIDWTLLKLIALLLMIAGGVAIFTGIFILAASICFWTVQGLEIANIFTDGGREMTQYPLNIYHKWVSRFFTFVIPFGCVNYLPLLYILGRDGERHALYAFIPLAGVIFLVPCLYVWKIGVAHYRSTGS